MDKDYLLKKWLKDELNPEETEAFNALEHASLYKEIIEEAQRFGGQKHAKVVSFETLDQKLVSKQTKSKHWIRTFSAIAAILVAGIALFSLWNEGSTTTISTVSAQQETITLPDNSLVELNQLSQLVYNKSNWESQRQLSLDGEAFFDVEKGKRFDVNTKNGTVSVLGTEFNVLSKDSVFKVTCYEGLVQVTYNNDTIQLPAGSEFALNSGVGVVTHIGVAEPYWLRQMSVFENASLATVIEELKSQYQIEVYYPSDFDAKFTGAFEHNNLQNALKSITQPLNLTFVVQNNNEEVIIRNE